MFAKFYKQDKYFLWCLFTISLSVRLFFYFIFLKSNLCVLSFDSGHYHAIAKNLIEGNGFASQLYRLPGYPIFLAVGYLIFGFNIQNVLLLQIVIASFLPILVFKLSMVLFPSESNVARIASIATAFNVGFLVFSGIVLTETLFVLFFFLFFLFLITGILNKPQAFNFLLAGIFIGVASLLRTNVGNASMVLGMFVILFCSNDKLNKRVINSISLGFGWFCLVAWWLVRNYKLSGYFIFSTLSGPHFINHSAARLAMQIYNLPYEQSKQIVYRDVAIAKVNQEYLLRRKLNEVEDVYVMEQVTQKYMLKKPLETIKHFSINIIKTCCSLYSSELLFVDSGGQLPQYRANENLAKLAFKFLNPNVSNFWIVPIIYFEIIFLLFMLFGMAGFLWQALRNRQNLKIVSLVFLYIFIFIGASLVCGYARLRLPVEPFCIILAVKYWVNAIRKKVSGE